METRLKGANTALFLTTISCVNLGAATGSRA